MAGGLTISTLNDSTGVLSVRNGMTGIPKAWVSFGGGSGTTAGTIYSSFNVSSITVVGTGIYTVNLSTSMPSANYAVALSVNDNASGSSNGTTPRIYSTTPPTASAFTIGCNNAGFGYYNTNMVYATVMSS